jgi:Na+/serine symporter
VTFDQIISALTVLTRMVASALWLVIALVFLALIMAARMRRKKRIARQMRASILDVLYETQCHAVAALKQALVENGALVLGVPNSDRLFSRHLDRLVRRGKVR